MPKILSQQQIDQYYEQGFLSPVDVMSEDEAISYRQKLEATERDYPDEINAQNRNNSHLSFSFLDKLVHHPKIVDAVEDLIGPNISLWGSVLFIKEPQTAGFVSWHQDATYMGIKPHRFVTPWLALTPSNLENGCMSMIPGSHIEHIREHRDTFDDDNILTRGQAVSNVDESTAVDLILRPGQMSLHNAEVIHGSRPNLGSDRRIGYAIQGYMPPPAMQAIGENYWLDIRGENKRENSIALHRPQFDMDPRGVAERKLVNENWANILYQGADQKRDY
jgi:non-heme Fe2+,alpha-ketoglutarate-dependent halogenase